MKRSLALVYVLGLFLLGILVGGLAMHLYYAALFPPHPPGPPHLPGGRFLERVVHQLDLTPEQTQRIGEIIQRSRVESEALRKELFPKVHAQMERTHEQILEVLTPEQREKFEELRMRHRGHSQRFFLGH